jgi:hypothetical protein
LVGHGDIMSCNQGEITLLIVAIVALVAVIRYYLIFNSYCARIAKLEGRTGEFQSLQSIEGGGVNFLELEQASKLLRREYLKFNDEQLTKLAGKLFQSGFVGLAAMIVAASWCAYLKLEICGSF